MRYEQLAIKLTPTLKKIAYKLGRYSPSLGADDLLQEELLHLWVEYKAGRLEDKTPSYILQGCYFHLKNFLRTHVDRAAMVSLEAFEGHDDEGLGLEGILPDEKSPSGREEAHCRMLIEQIRNNGLTAREKEVFNFCLEGLTTREIGSRMGISHVMVVKLGHSMRKKCLGHMDR